MQVKQYDRNKEHNGHKNYGYWSVSLNLNLMSKVVEDYIESYGKAEASDILMSELGDKEAPNKGLTSEGVPCNLTMIRAALSRFPTQKELQS